MMKTNLLVSSLVMMGTSSFAFSDSGDLHCHEIGNRSGKEYEIVLSKDRQGATLYETVAERKVSASLYCFDPGFRTSESLHQILKCEDSDRNKTDGRNTLTLMQVGSSGAITAHIYQEACIGGPTYGFACSVSKED